MTFLAGTPRLMPEDGFAWDDASNNKYLISGQGALIFNPAVGLGGSGA